MEGPVRPIGPENPPCDGRKDHQFDTPEALVARQWWFLVRNLMLWGGLSGQLAVKTPHAMGAKIINLARRKPLSLANGGSLSVTSSYGGGAIPANWP